MWLLILLLSSAGCVFCADCIYDPAHPQTNCLIYCIVQYSLTPQRRYYNETSQNCEYMNGCPAILYSTNYYDYSTNRCYDSPSMGKIVESPPDNNTGIIVELNTTIKFVCVYGTLTMVIAEKRYYCVCQLFWVSSNNMTASGNSLKCDRVETNMSKVFEKIEYQNGVAIKYDNFTAKQVDAMLAAALKVQARFKNQQGKASEVSVDFLLESLRKQPLISGNEIPVAVVLCFIVIMIMGLTVFNYHWNKIKVTKSRMKQRLEKAIQN